MFAWRKKSDGGFEWHEYIRTAVRNRREARRQRVQDARRAAGQQMQAAGVALAAGSLAAGSAARDGVRAGAGALGLAIQAGWSLLIYALRRLLRPVVAAVARPHIGVPVALAGAVAVGAGIGRWRGLGPDREAVLTLLAGVLLMAALVPLLARTHGWRMPHVAPGPAALAAGLVIALGVAAWLGSGGNLGQLAQVASISKLPFAGSSKTLQGRAQGAGADTLRVGATMVRLTGIEAPEREQRCGKTGREWRCGAAAETALSRLVDGRAVSCTPSGSDDAGRTLARCSVGDKDIGAELVRHGHVFADGTVIARYAGQEREARAAKAGLWAGEVERPAVYRAKLWDEAKKRAPDGCPIKGQVAGAARTYVLPWSPEYERVRIQKAKGERWFCSEQEALAAGFKAAQRG